MISGLEFLSFMTVTASEPVASHSHNCFELVYYIRGTGISTIDNTPFSYTGGSFCVILPGVAHSQSHHIDTEVIFIGFNFDNNPFALYNDLCKDNKEQTILDHMLKMKTELLEKNPHYIIKLEFLLKSLLIEVTRLKASSPSVDAEFTYIKRFIRENCSQKIDKELLSELSGYSYNRFRYLFKQDTGLSPLNYIIHHRIEKAKALLESSPHKVTAVAADCGFYDHSQFCAFFKRYTGMTPGEYRNEHS